MVEVERQLAAGRVSVCRGGARLARTRHQLAAAGLTEEKWQERWAAERLFVTADGEASKTWGNETIRWHPDEGWLEVKLPAPLGHLANRTFGRYRLSCPVTFTHRGDEVAVQATSGALRYDVAFDPVKHRWYLDASWRLPEREPLTLDRLRTHRVLAVDVNAGHRAAMVVDPSGNPVGAPVTVPIPLAGLPRSTRDGRLRAAVSTVLALAQEHDCGALVIEDLDFCEARELGREQTGRRPSRGKRDRGFRSLVAGIPTRRFCDRLVQMATNRGVAVVAVDPAYTSRWGAEHWLGALQQISARASGHHGAALVIGRRGLGHRARRRERCASSPPEDGTERATDSAGCGTEPTRQATTRKATGPAPGKSSNQRPPRRQKTRPGERSIVVDQVAQDRAGPPGRTLSCSVSRNGSSGKIGADDRRLRRRPQPPTADAGSSPADTRREDLPDVARLLSLSDGVVAIALTLLVLQLAVPTGLTRPDNAGTLWRHLTYKDHGDQFISYLISFYVIAQFWLAHHRVFRHMAGHVAGLAWWNFAFLFTITIMPFTSNLLGGYASNPLAVDIFAVNLLLASLATQAVGIYGRRRGLLIPGTTTESMEAGRIRALATVVAVGLSIGLAWVNTDVAKYCWILIAVIPLAVNHWTARRRQSGAGTSTPDPAGS